MRDNHNVCLEQFLMDFPGMAIRPSAGSYLRLKGTFRFSAEHQVHGSLMDAFNLVIDVPLEFPRDLPTVQEVGGRIPRRGEYHVNGDGSLCLGSHLRLLQLINRCPTLPWFAERCLIPYLYAVSKKLSDGGKLIFGELPHYGKGLLADYAQLFGLNAPAQAHYALELLTLKRRVANKRPCPCRCGQRLGQCRFNRRLLGFRKLAGRGWFRRQLVLAGS